MFDTISKSYSGTAVIDGDYPDELRRINQHCNDKTTVLEQVQRLFFNLRARLDMTLELNVATSPQEANHRYQLKGSSQQPQLAADFRTVSALCPTTIRRPPAPQSIGQFNRFLDKINQQVPAPYNAAFTDALRILTVCNEGEFQIDSYSEEGESVLVLNSSRLRQSIEFVVTH